MRDFSQPTLLQAEVGHRVPDHATDTNGIASKIGTVAGAYADAVDYGWDVEEMEVTVLDVNGTPIGFYRVETTWADQYNAGTISGEEYGLKVLTTLEKNGQ